MHWFTADTHFGHEKVIGHDRRPWATIQGHDEALIRNWNAVVAPDDIVWHLGDFAVRNKKHADWYLEQLNGHKYLIRGNHDDTTWKKATKFVDKLEAKYLRHEGERLYLSHYAHRVWRNSHHGAWHLYGHSHGNLPPVGRSLDVGTMNWGYRPVSFVELKEKLTPVVDWTHHHPQAERFYPAGTCGPGYSLTLNGRDVVIARYEHEVNG